MIGKSGLHAIRALAFLAGLPEGSCGSASAIADRIEAPPNYLGKLLQTLVREQLVASRKGHGGGFRLARDPRSIRLVDVLEPIEHVSRWSRCLLERRACSSTNACAVHARWASLRDQYVAMLAETTIADLARHAAKQADAPVRCKAP